MSVKRSFPALAALVLAFLLILGTGPATYAASGDLVITGVIDGPLSGGLPKAIELYAINEIPDLSVYGLGSANNGGGTDGEEFTFPADPVTAGTFIYVATESTGFEDFFGFAPTYTNSTAASINGDDAIELFQSGTVVDVFGEINVDGTGQPWEYLDGWAYRVDGTGQDGTTFVLANWTFSGPNALDGETNNGTAATPFPAGTYSATGGPPPAADPLINEFVFNHTGTDTAEFVEISGTPNADYSSFTLLEIEGDGSGAGTIDGAFAIGTTDPGGFWTTGFLNNEFENGTVTLLLVEDFSGALGNDLDTDNDGALDDMPWARIVDDVAVIDGGSSDHAYAGTILAPGYDGISFTVGGASRIPSGTDTDGVADWMRNDFDGFGLPGFDPDPPVGEAVNTPGFANAVMPAFTPIHDIQFTSDPGGESPLVGQQVTTFGVVTGAFDGGEDVFIQDGTGPWSGLFLFRPGASLSVGDLVLVEGEVSEFNGLTEIGFGSVSVLSRTTPPAPETLATGEVSQEQWESVLVRVADATVVDDDLGFGEWSVDDSSGPAIVDDLGDYDYVPRNGDFLAYVQGPLYFSFGNFKIEPRDNDDVQLSLVCGDPATLIHDIQGSGAASPLVGNTVVIEGVVVGDFQPDDGDVLGTDLGGFHVQEEDSDADADPATSEGIFVFAPDSVDVQVGDVVRVAGEVDEFFDLTELTDVSSVVRCSSGSSVSAEDVTLPVGSIDDLEAYEGMSVTFPQQLFISEFFNFDRFGEIVLTTERQFQPTAVFEPGSPEAAALAESNSLSRITLDDGRSSQNPDPARHPNGAVFDLANRFRGGDTVENVTGVLDYSFGLYRIQPTAGADYAVQNPRPAAPDPVGGNITVAAFNVLNYFTSIDFIQDSPSNNDPADDVCGPPGFEQECRGADNENELERQRAKIVAALATLDADVVGLIEIQNDEGASTADLVSGLNDLLGAGTYDYIQTGFIGTDAIKQAFIYQPATVTPVGDYAVLDSDAFVDPNNLGDPKNRPALAQTFMDNETGGIFTPVVNHFKSKGSPCGPSDDDPQQGNCNLTRTLAAQVLADWLATDPTGSGDEDFLIIGDLNSYDKEDPIDVLKANGYADLIFDYGDGGEFAYSYVFDGQLGYLDYGMANQALASEVTGTTVWHINTDEPDILDYDTTFKRDAQDALYEPNAYRSSDHDPVLVGLDVCDEIAPELEVTVTPDTLWPPQHQYVTVEATVVASDNVGPNPTVTLLSVTSNEPDDGEDDGNTINDIVIVDDDTFQLRAERSGVGTGRVYTIVYEATDSCGNSTVVEAMVTVPLSMEGGRGP